MYYSVVGEVDWVARKTISHQLCKIGAKRSELKRGTVWLRCNSKVAQLHLGGYSDQ